MAQKILILIFMAAFFSVSKAQDAPFSLAQNVDLEKYSGLWHEIASFPQRFQKGCTCTQAEYSSTNEGYVKVVNSCIKKGELSRVSGKAFVVPSTGNAWLKVQFFWPFKGDYQIIELDENYQWAAVGSPSRKYLWILSRTKEIDEKLYGSICAKLVAKGFDIKLLQKCLQNCQ